MSSNRVEQGMGKKILKHTFITSRKRERPSPSSERVREEGKMGGREETIYKKVAGLIFSHSTTNFRTVIIVPTELSGLDWTRLGRQRRRQAEWRKAAQWRPDQKKQSRRKPNTALCAVQRKTTMIGYGQFRSSSLGFSDLLETGGF